VTAADPHRVIDAIWRIESAKLIAGLARIVRGDLLAKLGRLDDARAELERAASLTRNARERTLLLERAAACARKA
jgi:predicted RNA polymerase sigma factor